MKYLFTLFVVLFTLNFYSQVPNSFSYRSTLLNEENQPVKNQKIKIEVNVLNGDFIDAKVLYAETHEQVTSSLGNYYLKIGDGKPLKDFEDLTDVLWSEEGDKFLHIKVFDDSGKLLSNGINQLMSVPYALVAKETLNNRLGNSCSIVEVVDNVDSLKTFLDCDGLTPTPFKEVYVQGYSQPKDKGGGHFVFLAYDNSPPVTGMIIKHNNLENGRWHRHNYREVSVSFFGATGGGVTSAVDTDAIQEAIDFVYNNSHKGGTVYFPKGNYNVEQIILRDGVSLKGEFEGTDIAPTLDSRAEALVILDPDSKVENISIEDISFTGNVSYNPPEPGTEADMHCFALNATKPSLNPGGLWKSSFKNINIKGFKNDAIRFQGGTVDSIRRHPNQFITMVNVRAIKSDINKSSRALYMHGQNAQFSFINCTFSGPKGKDGKANPEPLGTNVFIQSPINKDFGPFSSLIRFDTCTFEEAELGIHIIYGLNINIDGCWFENLYDSIKLFDRNLGINISNNRFTNAARKIPATSTYGFILTSNNSSAQFSNNTIRGDYSGISSTIGNGGIFSLVNTSGTHHHFYGNNNNRKTDDTSTPIVFFDQ